MPEDARLRKIVVMAAGLVVIAALCVAVILLAGSRPEEASKTSAPEESGQEGNGSDQAPAREPTMIGGRRVLTEREALVKDARWLCQRHGCAPEGSDPPPPDARRHVTLRPGA